MQEVEAPRFQTVGTGRLYPRRYP